MKLTALVPMKAHSERVPNKNIKSFAGKPLLSRIIKSLALSNFIERIIVNTDGKEIAELARRVSEKVEIYWRPKDLQGDFVSMNKIIGYDLQNCSAEHFLQTHSTNPLISTETIDLACKRYADHLGDFDSLFTVNRFQSRFYDQNLQPLNHDPNELIRTQDLPPLFEENSCLYLFSRQAFNKRQQRVGVRPQLFETPKFESIDIDEEDDFLIAEAIFQSRQ